MSPPAFSCLTCASRLPSHSIPSQQSTKPLTTPTPRPRPRPRPPQHPDPDLHLLALARQATKLSPARKTLRRKLKGQEPPLIDLVHFASFSDTSLSNDFNTWKNVFEARNHVTVKWLWLVAAVARKAYRTYLDAFPEMRTALSLADITQEGVCGLITSVERWDPGRDYAFDAYAFYSIKHAILRAIENQSRPIRLPVHVLNKLSKMQRIRRTLTMTHNQEPSIEQVAKLAGVHRDDAQLYLNRSRKLFSIDVPLGNHDGAATLREFLVDTKVDVARHVERSCTRQAVAELVEESNLEDLERSVLLLKYGLKDGVERMRAEVSRILNVRVEKVRRAELRALKKLRDTVGHDMTAWTELIS